jgi:5'-nucleotidase
MVKRIITPDHAITTVINKWFPLYEPKANESVGSITKNIESSVNRDTESALANLIADSMLEATATPPNKADMAFINPGAIRADLNYKDAYGDKGPGQVSYSDTYNVLPFGNTIVTLTMTGGLIKQALEQQFIKTGRARSQLILGISKGLRFEYITNNPEGSRISNITLNGIPLDMSKQYHVTLGDFLASGGDSFIAFKSGTNPIGGGVDLEVLTAYLIAHSPVSPPPLDRIDEVIN